MEKKTESKTVMNGAYEVRTDGTVYRIMEDGEKRKMKIGLTGAFSSYIAGKQKNVYARRLIASAFIPNPNGKKDAVINLDGDKQNNRVENLKWVTRSELARIGNKNRWRSCTLCGESTCAGDGICSNCKEKIRLQEIREKKKPEAMLRRKKRGNEMDGISIDCLTPRERTAAELRKEGNSINEIAAIMGCTRQNVYILLKFAKKNGGKG